MIIYKYVIEPIARYALRLPLNSRVLSAQNQQEELCVWVEIADSNEKDQELHILRIVMTGQDIEPQPMRFIDTVQMADGYLVLHVFEEI